MTSTKLFVLLFIGAVMLCQVSGFLDELLAEHELDTDKRACNNRYTSNICGKLITQEHCSRGSSSRMGKFAKTSCRRLCGLC